MSLDNELNQAHYQANVLPDGRTRFIVTPAPVPRLTGLYIFIAVMCSLLGALLLSWAGPLSLLGLIGGGFGGYRFSKWYWSRNVNKRRSAGGDFIAGAVGIEINGQTIPSDRIHQLIIRNGMDLARDVNVVMDNVGAQRHANIALASQVAYLLQVESAGRATTLAGGMTRTCATGLFTDVTKALSPS